MVEQINDIAQVWYNWMLPMFWQVSLLIVIITLADLFLRKRVWPQVRYALWMLVLIKLIIPPGFALSTSIISQIRANIPQKNMQPETTQIESSPIELASENIIPDIEPRFEPVAIPEETKFVLPAESISQPNTNNPIVISEKVSFNWKVWLMTVWFIGVITLLFWAVIRYRALRKRFCTKANKANIPKWFESLLNETANRLKLRKIPQISFSNNISSPAVFGTFKPVLVLPSDISLSQQSMEHILLHELAHIKRLDLKVNTLTTLLQIVYWFNPLLFFTGKRLRHLRELCCDATVAGILREQTSDYRMTIMESARRFFTKPTELGMGLLGLFEDSSSLANRLKWLEKKTWKYRTIQILTTIIVVTLMALYILPMAKARKVEASEISISHMDGSEIDPQELITCTGKIVDNQGKSVKGANISVYERFQGGGSTKSFILRQVGQTITSDAEGKFTFKTNSKVWIMRSLERMGQFEQGIVVIQKDSFALDWAKWDIDSDIDINVTLTKSQSIEGIVVDETGKSIPNAQVHAIVYKNKQSTDDIIDWISGFLPIEGLNTVSDKQGRFKVSNLRENNFVDLFVTAQDKASISTYHEDLGPAFTAGKNNIRIVLQEEGRIKGKLVDITTGKGIPNLPITAKPRDLSSPILEPPRFSPYFFEPLTTKTNQDGAFTIGGLCEGYYALLGDLPAKDKIFVEKGKDSNDVLINCQGYVHGYVKDSDGNPVVGTDVQIRAAQSPNLGSATSGQLLLNSSRTDENGYYINAHIRGPYTVSAGYNKKNKDGNGYRSSSYQRKETFQGTQQVDLQFGTLSDEGTSKLVGYVRDQNNEILRDFIVQFTHSVENNPEQLDSGFSIKQIFYTTDGKFELSNLPEGKYTLTMNSIKTDDQYEFPMFLEVILEKDKTTERTFSIIKKQAYYGRVLFEDGTPAYFDPPPWPKASVSIEVPAQIGNNYVYVDKDGYFEVFLKDAQYESIKSGQFDMRIAVPSLEWERARIPQEISFPPEKLSTDKSKAGVITIPKPSNAPELNPANTPSLLQKQLPDFNGIEINQNSETKDNENITVKGYVTDKLGRPRHNVYIVQQLNNVRNAIRTDELGQFILEGIPPEQKSWIAYSAASPASQALGLFTIPDNYDGRPIHVTLDYYDAKIDGRVIGPNGRGLPGRIVEFLIKTEQGNTYISKSQNATDGYGNYDFVIPCGSGLSIQARIANANNNEKQYITEAIDLPDNQIFIQLPTLVIGEGKPEESDDGKVLVSGQILNENGKPVSGATVALYFDMPGYMSTWIKEVMTDESGRWKRRIPKDYSGLSIDLLHPEYLRQRGIRVSPEELQKATSALVMKKGIKLRGVVKNEQSEPVVNALINAGGSNRISPYGEVMENCMTPRTVADGSFSLGGLVQESVNIVVSCLGYAPKIESLDIMENMEPIEIILNKGKTYTGQVVDANDNPIEGVPIDIGDWRIGNERGTITRITKTDSQGIFKIENLPDVGTITLDYGGSRQPLLFFRRDIPEDFPEMDKVVMYPVPVFTGKVIDAETEKPITKFTLTSGIKSKNFDPDGSTSWSTYYKDEVISAEGKFSYKWSGFAISYPFDGQCELKVEADGYLDETAPSITLGQHYEPAVIRMTKGKPFTGTITDSEGKPISGAEVGWIGPDSKAYINSGKFDQRGLADQTQKIVRTNSNGEFELPPSRDEGLIVVVHENNGYASISSNDFENGSQIKLKPWAKIEGTIISADENRKEYTVLINTAISDEELSEKKIRWIFDGTSYSQKNFVINFVPSEPFYICQYINSERMKREYLEPQPGQTYKVELSYEPGIVSGRIIEPEPLEGKELPKMNDIQISGNDEQLDSRMTLICFWDFEQRPSRNMITQLSKRIQDIEEKSISVLTINTSDTEQKVLDDWLKEQNINLKVGKITADVEKTKFNWGVKSLPWLILTDENHIVITEGFNLEDVDEKISGGIEEIYKSPEIPSNVELKGKVLTQDGKPVAGVTVYLGNTYITKDSSIELQMNESAQPTWQGGEYEPAYIETDSDGGFVFDKLSPGKTDIWAEHPEFGICWLRDISSGKKDVELILKPQPKIIKYTGQVTDFEKRPVSNARILIYTENDRILIGQTKCNKQGIFEIEVEPPWTHYRHLMLLCTSENNPPAWRRLLYASADNLQIKLKEQTQISGKVVDSEGKGITDAKILFHNVEDTDYGEIFFSRRDEIIQVAPSTKTDSNGNFTIRQVPLGSTISLRAEHPEYTSKAEWNISAFGQEIKIEDIQLPDGATIEGTVYFADTKKPAQGVTVKATSFNRVTRQTVTDNNGKYFLKGIEDIDLYEIISVSAEYPEINPEWAGQIEVEKDVMAGDHLTIIDINLEKSFEYRQKNWLAQRGKIIDGPRIVVLDDADRAYNGKTIYDDTVTMYDGKGQQQWQKTGFNTCQSIGAKHSIAYNKLDKSIWLVEEAGKRLVKMDIEGNVLLKLENIRPHSIAIDPKTGNLWVLTTDGTIYGKNLVILNSKGEIIKELPHKGFDIAYSEKDDCFWLAGKQVMSINRDYQAQNWWPGSFEWVAVSVNINNNDGSVWVSEGRHPQVPGSEYQILILEPDGSTRKKINLEEYGRGPIIVDSQRNTTWVATYRGILKMNLDGEIIKEIPLSGFSICLEPDTGYVWVGDNEGIYKLDSDGKLVWSKETPGGSHKWICVIPD